jgi:hypothetical protein
MIPPIRCQFKATFTQTLKAQNTANSLLQDGEDYENESLFSSKHLALKLRQ